jgi:hypothetical protein
MTSLNNKILPLDDKTAVNILQTFAKAQLNSESYYTELKPSLRKELMEEFNVTELKTHAPGEGELARQALLLLAEDPQYVEVIGAIVAAPIPEKFLGVVETVSLVAAILVVLQTQVRFERDKEGRYSFIIEKKSTSESLLKLLIQKLLAFI